MRAMVLERPGERLQMRELLDRAPGPGEVRLAVSACGVCRTICTSTANCRTRSYR
jgi:propanol-preferring alcohol dehydrogenase